MEWNHVSMGVYGLSLVFQERLEASMFEGFDWGRLGRRLWIVAERRLFRIASDRQSFGAVKDVRLIDRPEKVC